MPRHPSGAEFGWRNGAGKRPEFYPDNLPPTLNIGPGSPTGVTFGYGAKFPAKYQDAFFACDWSYGKLYAVHLTPDGAGYTGKAEEFVTGTPLPLTDVVMNPVDGAMYFAVGGRKTQSGLYRVRYTGADSTEPSKAKVDITPEAAKRRELEAFLKAGSKPDPEFNGFLLTAGAKARANEAVKAAWPHLSSRDRTLRTTARAVLEMQPKEVWREKALAETDPSAQLAALLGLTRATSACPEHEKLNSKKACRPARITPRTRVEQSRRRGKCCAPT